MLQELKAQGAAFLRNPPPGFSEQRLLDPHGVLMAFQEPLLSTVRQAEPLLARQGTAMRMLSQAEVIDRVPVLSPDYFDGGLSREKGGHIDVHELLWSYLRHAERRAACGGSAAPRCK